MRRWSEHYSASSFADLSSPLIKELDSREQQIIVLRYFKEKTQTEVAKTLGISQVQVSRIEKKVLLEMRKKIAVWLLTALFKKILIY